MTKKEGTEKIGSVYRERFPRMKLHWTVAKDKWDRDTKTFKREPEFLTIREDEGHARVIAYVSAPSVAGVVERAIADYQGYVETADRMEAERRAAVERQRAAKRLEAAIHGLYRNAAVWSDDWKNLSHEMQEFLEAYEAVHPQTEKAKT